MLRTLSTILLLATTTAAAAEWAGNWTGTLDRNGSKVRVFLTLNQNGDELVGTVATGADAKPARIENAAVNGSILTFDVHDNARRVVRFRLMLNGGRLTGESTVDGQVSTVSMASPGRNVAVRVGNGVSAPALLFKVEPEYSEEARAAKFQGTVLLYVEVDPTGRATNIKVQGSLGLGLDEKAIEAVQRWKFKPGMKDGNPVTVAATIEVNFRL